MKKILLMLLFVALSASSLLAMQEEEIIYVNKPTLDFILECQNIFNNEDKGIDVKYDSLLGMYTQNPYMKTCLNKIDARFNLINFNIYPTKENMISLRTILCGRNVNIQSGDRLLTLGVSFLTNKIQKVTFIETPYDVAAHNKPSLLPSFIHSSFFKASFAATATGLVTYSAIWFYNKDKAKERQLSKLKWSLGAALVVGAGTYLWLR